MFFDPHVSYEKDGTKVTLVKRLIPSKIGSPYNYRVTVKLPDGTKRETLWRTEFMAYTVYSAECRTLDARTGPAVAEGSTV